MREEHKIFKIILNNSFANFPYDNKLKCEMRNLIILEIYMTTLMCLKSRGITGWIDVCVLIMWNNKAFKATIAKLRKVLKINIIS